MVSILGPGQRGGQPARERGRPRSQAADRAILDACLELLGERGLAGLTLEGVAARAGCSKATIHRRWPTKLRLVAEAIAQLPPIAEADTGSLAGDLRALLRSFAAILARTPLLRVMPVIVGELAHDPALATLLEPLWSARRAPLHRALERAIDRGELRREVDLELAIDLLVGPLLARLFFGGTRPTRRRVDAVVTLALAGLAAQRPAARARLARRRDP